MAKAVLHRPATAGNRTPAVKRRPAAAAPVKRRPAAAAQARPARLSRDRSNAAKKRLEKSNREFAKRMLKNPYIKPRKQRTRKLATAPNTTMRKLLVTGEETKNGVKKADGEATEASPQAEDEERIRRISSLGDNPEVQVEPEETRDAAAGLLVGVPAARYAICGVPDARSHMRILEERMSKAEERIEIIEERMRILGEIGHSISWLQSELKFHKHCSTVQASANDRTIQNIGDELRALGARVAACERAVCEQQGGRA